MNFILPVLKFVAISVSIYLLIAMVLIVSQRPKNLPEIAGLNFEALSNGPFGPDTPLSQYQARDGATLGFRHFKANVDNAPLLVLVHGSGAHGGGYLWIADQLAKAGIDVILPDLRGHGPNASPRGDIAYIGQFEDDLADLITQFHKDGQKLFLGGHSSGGGLAVRFSGGEYGGMLDGAVLLAPFLNHNAATTRSNSGGWANVLLRRTIGLAMLNMVGIKVFNGLTHIQFNLPKSVRDSAFGAGMTDAYSFRLNTSYAPRNDYMADIASLPPFALVVGANDEAFHALEYEGEMSAVTNNGHYHVLKDTGHLNVYLRDETVALVSNFIKGNK